ncbi:hypothetical protein AYO21_04305 [Fonsecaea monophora]|uniref:L-serine ammonia-lyase n=1 Tax=Fonsecaea monophora TaxID=254056 RepID=A0A177FAR0_9EURO|nr:hypothetical protein AYO21_04305 [Fonsecaea monophora]OAG41363.1 hypothetical protein AYO21_04305 [Fonsecaea monophora]
MWATARIVPDTVNATPSSGVVHDSPTGGMTRGLKKPWVSTPLIESPGLSEAAGCRIFLKLDNFQPSGSFKSRGVGNYVLQRVRERQDASCGHLNNKTHFYASSGGNAGLACVHAARSLGYPATVVVPTATKPDLVAMLWAKGAANVIQHGHSVLEADRYLKETVLKSDPDGVYVPPFDHPDIWDGNSTVMDEIATQMHPEKPDVVVCSVGGGGLLNGIMQSLDARSWIDDVSVVAMETQGADSLSQSLKAGRLITMDKITSQARSLGVARVSQRTWEYAQRPRVISAVLPDDQAAKGSLLLAQTEKIIAELTVGVNIALCFDGLLEKVLGRKVTKSTKVVIVVCGGNDINLEMLTEWMKAGHS